MGIKPLLDWFLSMLTLVFLRKPMHSGMTSHSRSSIPGLESEPDIKSERPSMEEGKNTSVRFLTFVSQSIFFETSGDRSGAYTHDPADSGGETKWGISKGAHPHLNIKAVTYNQAVDIYGQEYWNKLYDYILNDALAFKLFDMGILNGPAKAVKVLQKAVKKSGLLVRVDGRFGPLTLTAANNINHKELYENYIKLFNTRFRRLVLRVQKNRRYLGGWLNRLNWRWQGDNQ